MSIPIKAKEKKKKESRLSFWLLRSLWGVRPAGLLCSKFTFANICHAFFGDLHYFCCLSKGLNSAPVYTRANTPSQTQMHVSDEARGGNLLGYMSRFWFCQLTGLAWFMRRQRGATMLEMERKKRTKYTESSTQTTLLILLGQLVKSSM